MAGIRPEAEVESSLHRAAQQAETGQERSLVSVL